MNKISLQIRASTQHKKFVKNISKMKSLDTSNAAIEVTENDKTKLAKQKTTLDLVKKLSGTFINSEDKGFVLNPRDLKVQLIQLSKNNSNQDNREVLWKQIGSCSSNNEEWSRLFNSHS